jgi:hypothetical protein
MFTRRLVKPSFQIWGAIYGPWSATSADAVAASSTIAVALPRPTTDIAATATTARHIPSVLSLLLLSMRRCQRQHWHFYYCCHRRRFCCCIAVAITAAVVSSRPLLVDCCLCPPPSLSPPLLPPLPLPLLSPSPPLYRRCCNRRHRCCH